jgi:aldehyde dehydrogenase (NAD+)
VATANLIVPDILEKLHIEAVNSGACHDDWIAEPAGSELISLCPATGEPLARVRMAGAPDYEAVVERASRAFLEWRMIPAPHRGEIVREIGNELRAHKEDLGALVSLEMGKILPEGLGEVQEMIDIADFAVGLSRQLYGLTMHSERPGHRMYEQWHPLGIVGVISLQLPGGGVGLERHDRRSVRGLRSVAALFGNAAHRNRRTKDRQPGLRPSWSQGHIQSRNRTE